MVDSLLDTFSDDEKRQIVAYLERTYVGVFSEEAVQSHLENYVGENSQLWPLAVLEQHIPPGASVMDIGCGFGSFVLMARMRGYMCCGIEPSGFETTMARLRLARLLPQDDPEQVYHVGTAEDLRNSREQYNAVTLWNVLEHIPDTARTIQLCRDLLLPGGKLFIVCPNYFAWRDEAHYHLPWSPLDFCCPSRFTKRLSAAGRNPDYFINGIVPVANWTILAYLWRAEFTVYTFSGLRLTLGPSRSLRETWERLSALSPFVHSTCLVAIKDH
ncbi:MAG: methyltransferase domain-containing protein [Desulfovibrionaceae bacterium]|nr:methyltransferase domain-containing protein [Desulfovibrionaceae bacterium]